MGNIRPRSSREWMPRDVELAVDTTVPLEVTADLKATSERLRS